MADAALFEFLPALKGRVPFLGLGQWPSPLETFKLAPLVGREVLVKREDQSAAAYGGNKIRTLETLLADAMQKGCKRIWSTGAYGSNHALASAIHSHGLGLSSAALLFPQPATRSAAENLEQLYSLGVEVRALRSIVTFPFSLAALFARSRARGDYIMLPGGAVPLGALGHVGAAFELAVQINASHATWPRHLVIACGSTCTTAGLLCGFVLARGLGLWPAELPLVHALRVTPWPVTAAGRIVGLARRTGSLVHALGGPASAPTRVLRGMLRVHGRYLGWGYGRPTQAGTRVIREHGAETGFPLETTYTSKSLAGLLDLLPALEGPVVYWATKSSSALPKLDVSRLGSAPPHVRRWLGRAT
jgi:D-cysteine desulfhydrase